MYPIWGGTRRTNFSVAFLEFSGYLPADEYKMEILKGFKLPYPQIASAIEKANDEYQKKSWMFVGPYRFSMFLVKEDEAETYTNIAHAAFAARRYYKSITISLLPSKTWTATGFKLLRPLYRRGRASNRCLSTGNRDLLPKPLLFELVEFPS